MICDKSKCTGCYACYNICPKKAISMKEDSNGFVYPSIDDEKCINCGLCKRRCPMLNNLELKYPIACYAFQRDEKEKLSESTSGGAAAVLSEFILNNKGRVYGVKYDKNNGFIFTGVSDLEDLKAIKGSKYVHSYIKDIYTKIKQNLDKNILILFIGTPCQVAGLKKFLGKEYKNLYLVDIICHGVPSQKYLFAELENNGVNIKNITKVTFRGDDGFKLKAYNNDEIVYEKDMEDSFYFKGFMDSFFYRENCYSCKFAGINRISDLTIGDFWGLGSDSSLYSKREKGVSVLLPVTDKGKMLIKQAFDNKSLEERTIDEAQNGNAQLKESVKMDKKYFKFKKDFERYGFEKSYKNNRKTLIIKKKLKKIKVIRKIVDFIKKR